MIARPDFDPYFVVTNDSQRFTTHKNEGQSPRCQRPAPRVQRRPRDAGSHGHASAARDAVRRRLPQWCGGRLATESRSRPHPQSHTDLHIHDGRYDLGGGKILDLQGRGLKLPLAMGHEIVGKVVALGPDAKGVSVGEQMIVSWHTRGGGAADCDSVAHAEEAREPRRNPGKHRRVADVE